MGIRHGLVWELHVQETTGGILSQEWGTIAPRRDAVCLVFEGSSFAKDQEYLSHVCSLNLFDNLHGFFEIINIAVKKVFSARNHVDRRDLFRHIDIAALCDMPPQLMKFKFVLTIRLKVDIFNSRSEIRTQSQELAWIPKNFENRLSKMPRAR
jgi:hypothetical protein